MITRMPSGAELNITLGSFLESKALYQAILDEAKNLKLDPKEEIGVNMMKDLFCAGFSSKKIEDALWVCMKRCAYKGMRIDADTFESVEAREDYFSVCIEVAKENVLPFTKALTRQYSQILENLKSSLA